MTNNKMSFAQSVWSSLQNDYPFQYHLLRFIGSEAKQADQTAYVIGGFVRDLCHSLLYPDATLETTQPNGLDLDVVLVHDEFTRAQPASDCEHSALPNALEFAQQLHEAYGGHIVAHERFGTATWFFASKARRAWSGGPISPPERSGRFAESGTWTDWVRKT